MSGLIIPKPELKGFWGDSVTKPQFAQKCRAKKREPSQRKGNESSSKQRSFSQDGK